MIVFELFVFEFKKPPGSLASAAEYLLLQLQMSVFFFPQPQRLHNGSHWKQEVPLT